MQRRRKLFLIFLFFFALTSSCVDFFHTETTLEPDEENCPACLFKSSFFSTTAVFHCVVAYTILLILVFGILSEKWVRLYGVRAVRNKSPPAFSLQSA